MTVYLPAHFLEVLIPHTTVAVQAFSSGKVTRSDADELLMAAKFAEIALQLFNEGAEHLPTVRAAKDIAATIKKRPIVIDAYIKRRLADFLDVYIAILAAINMFDYHSIVRKMRK